MNWQNFVSELDDLLPMDFLYPGLDYPIRFQSFSSSYAPQWNAPQGPGSFYPPMGPPPHPYPAHHFSCQVHPPRGAAHGAQNYLKKIPSRPGIMAFDLGGIRLEMPKNSYEMHQQGGVTTFTPRHHTGNRTSRAPPQQAARPAPPTPAPKNKNKDTREKVMPSVPAPQPRVLTGGQGAQASNAAVVDHFIYYLDNSKTMRYVSPEDVSVLDLVGLWNITHKNAAKSPPSFQCPCCSGLGLRDVDHCAFEIHTINCVKKGRLNIICPVLLKYFKKQRAAEGGTSGGSKN